MHIYSQGKFHSRKTSNLQCFPYSSAKIMRLSCLFKLFPDTLISFGRVFQRDNEKYPNQNYKMTMPISEWKQHYPRDLSKLDSVYNDIKSPSCVQVDIITVMLTSESFLEPAVLTVLAEVFLLPDKTG